MIGGVKAEIRTQVYPTPPATLSAPHLLLSFLASAAETGVEVSPNRGLVLAPSFSEADSLTVPALGRLCVFVCAVGLTVAKVGGL